jgi:hypothetical protein
MHGKAGCVALAWVAGRSNTNATMLRGLGERVASINYTRIFIEIELIRKYGMLLHLVSRLLPTF